MEFIPKISHSKEMAEMTRSLFIIPFVGSGYNSPLLQADVIIFYLFKFRRAYISESNQLLGCDRELRGSFRNQ